MLVFGVISFTTNSLIAKKLYKHGVFRQDNVIFHADPYSKLKAYVHGATYGTAGRSIIHPNLANFFNPPIRILAKIITWNQSWERRIEVRTILGWLVVPFFVALNAMVVTLLFYKLKFSVTQICLLNLLGVFSFSQLVFGSIPDHFAINGFFITGYYLLGLNLIETRKIHWPLWLVFGVFGTGIVLTNIIIMGIILLVFLLYVTNNFRNAVTQTIIISSVILVVTFALSLGLSQIYKKEQTALSSVNVEKTKRWIGDYFNKEPFKRGVFEFPVAFAAALSSNKVLTVEDPRSIKEKQKYRDRFTLGKLKDFDSVDAIALSLTAFMAILGTYNMLRSDTPFRPLAIASLLIVVYNWSFHALWGTEYFIYSPHWLGASIILISGIFLTKRPFLRPITAVFSIILIYAIYNNFNTISEMMYFLKNYTS